MKLKLAIFLCLLPSFMHFRESKSNTIDNDWKKYNLKAPVQLVIDEFKNHEIILLGETHRKRNDVLFLQRLIPSLHKNGINILFYEFASYEDNKRIDSVLTANEYDEEKVKSIIHDNFWEWPYKEYLDVFKAAWFVYDRIGKKVMTIWIHFPWGNADYDAIYTPVVKYLDSIAYIIKKPFAFDTKNSMLGELADSVSVYSIGYNKIKLKEIVDGYIVLSPTCQDDFVTFIPEFNENTNIGNANKQIDFLYKYKPLTVKQANDTLQKWYSRDSFEFYDFRKHDCCH